MRLSTFGMTDAGRKRPGNEDAILVVPELALAVVCDGMGGHEAGEVASRTAVEAIYAWFTGGGDEGERYNLDPNIPAPARKLASSVFYADEAIRQAVVEAPEHAGMGTTVVAALIEDGMLFVAHAGDSRCYLGRGRGLIQVTLDHTVVGDLLRAGVITEGQAVHVKKNAITRALGVTEGLIVDVDQVHLGLGDTVLLCSDGLHGLINDASIGSLVCSGTPLEDTCKNLIDAANEAGGSDNISAVLLRLER
ncbi:MAG: PP2C family serine/threonine-protein phosphatase [Myxococcota bacterium]